MARIAIYDLDRTITRKPTFTPFLLFAAWHLAPWRLVFTPVWVVAMAGYRIGLYTRTALKRFGLRLLTGRASLADLRLVGARFARARIAKGGLMPGTLHLMAQDRAAGARIVIATAAFDFYAEEFARSLGIDDVVATTWDEVGISGGNCYGVTKRDRFLSWSKEKGIELEDAHIRFVSDSFADEPLFDLAHEPIFMTTSRRAAARARVKGWDARNPCSVSQ